MAAPIGRRRHAESGARGGIAIDILAAARLIADGQVRVERLLADFTREGTLPHALLFTGPEGSGKALIATELAARVNCDQEGEVPDGSCAACGKVRRLEHPDQHLVFPVPSSDWEKAVPAIIESRREDFFAGGEFGGRARSIGIGMIRRLIEAVSKHPFEGRRNVLVLFEAHLMTVEAQNAFLKVLEEPPPSALLVLVTEHPDKLLDTVVSRCQQVRFDYLAPDTIRLFLERFYSVERREAERLALLSEGNLRRGIRLLDEEFVTLRSDAAALLKVVMGGSGRDILGEAERVSRQYDRESVGTLMGEMAGLLRMLLRARSGIEGAGERALLEEALGAEISGIAATRDIARDLRALETAAGSLSRNADLELTMSHLLLDLAGKWY